MVTGLEDIPPDERPPANTLLHLSFDAMVGIGTALLLLGAWIGWVWWRRRDFPQTPWFLRAVAVSGVAAVIALWCGWIVTEVGRQPWIVQGHMRTSEAVTEAEGLWFAFAGVLRALRGAGHDRDPRPALDVAPLARARRTTAPTVRDALTVPQPRRG